jgi:hypothetical protein
MSKIPTIAEQNLADLQPSKLDEDFMSRLLASADGSVFELTAEELQFEASLRRFAPRKLSPSIDSPLFSALSDTPFHVDEKIVLFHKATPGSRKTSPASRRFNIAAAAAVAILGAMAAWITPHQLQQVAGNDRNPANHPPVISSLPNTIAPSSFSPAAFNRNLSDTRDEGVIWNPSNRPHRVIRFTYMDRITLKNEKGESIEVEQPREEYVIIPEKMD